MWRAIRGHRMTQALKRKLISPRLDDSLSAIVEMSEALAKDIPNQNKYPLLVNLLILSTIHEREAIAIAASSAAAAGRDKEPSTTTTGRRRSRPGRLLASLRHVLPTPNPGHKQQQQGKEQRLVASDDAVEMAARFVRFASSSYGLVMLKGLNIIPISEWPPLDEIKRSKELRRKNLNEWCILKHTGVEKEALLKVKLDADYLRPGYFIAIDHSSQSIILAVRGTRCLKDAITDLVCDNTDFLGELAHRGMAEGARLLLEDCKDELLLALEQHRGYRLVLTGHSMGGGVATLLALFLKAEGEAQGFRCPVECYAFAPPPTMTLAQTPPTSAEGIFSIVFRHDVVPRLSLAHAYELMCVLKEVDDLPAGHRQRVKYLLGELTPNVRAQDDGLGMASVQISSVRYSTRLHNTHLSNNKSGGHSHEGESGRGGGGGGGGRGRGESSSLFPQAPCSPPTAASPSPSSAPTSTSNSNSNSSSSEEEEENEQEQQHQEQKREGVVAAFVNQRVLLDMDDWRRKRVNQEGGGGNNAQHGRKGGMRAGRKANKKGGEAGQQGNDGEEEEGGGGVAHVDYPNLQIPGTIYHILRHPIGTGNISNSSSTSDSISSSSSSSSNSESSFSSTSSSSSSSISSTGGGVGGSRSEGQCVTDGDESLEAGAQAGAAPDHGRSAEFSMERASAADFDKILLVDTAAVDHWPSAYEQALGSLLASCGRGKGGGDKTDDGSGRQQQQEEQAQQQKQEENEPQE